MKNLLCDIFGAKCSCIQNISINAVRIFFLIMPFKHIYSDPFKCGKIVFEEYILVHLEISAKYEMCSI